MAGPSRVVKRSSFHGRGDMPSVSSAPVRSQSSLQEGDIVVVEYGNKFYGRTGEIDEFQSGFIIVRFPGGDSASMHSSDVRKATSQEEEEYFDGDYDEFDESVARRVLHGLGETPRKARKRV